MDELSSRAEQYWTRWTGLNHTRMKVLIDTERVCIAGRGESAAQETDSDSGYWSNPVSARAEVGVWRCFAFDVRGASDMRLLCVCGASVSCGLEVGEEL